MKKRRSKNPEYRRRQKPGTAPGTLVAHDGAAPSRLHVYACTPQALVEKSDVAPEDLPAFLRDYPLVWVDIDGLGDVDLLNRVGAVFGLHTLALEDVVNVHQRAKVEKYDDHLFIVTRQARLLGDGVTLDIEQISLFLGQNFVLTLQERGGDCLDPVRARLRRGKGRIRSSGADYLAHAILDTIVDGYFPVLEFYSDRIDDSEEAVLSNPVRRTVVDIHDTKRKLLSLRRALWPQRDMVSALAHEELIQESNRVYFRDCQDHLIQLIDILESQRERLSGLTELYLSSLNNRMNEIMKVLTVITTIFMPLSFIAGVYGMNFHYMPELSWPYGYEFALALMLVVALLFGWYFRRKGWLG